MAARTLSGRTIVVTRPRGQADHLAELIRQRDGQPLLYPAIDIAPLPAAPEMLEVVERLDAFDVAVFVSANAAEHGLALVRAHRAWPARLPAVAVGPGTARALQAAGLGTILTPQERFDSEGVLALPVLQGCAGTKVLIVRGVGGRDLMGAQLAARGALVTFLEVYRRGPPSADPAPLIERWRTGTIDAVSVTSSEALANFDAVLGEEGRAYLRQTVLFVPHARIAAAARALGLTSVVESATGDDAIVAALEAFFARVAG